MRTPLSLALTLLVGCSLGNYQRLETSGLARTVPWAAARRLGCLDLGLHLARHPEVPREFSVVQFELGNRCEAAVRVDLTAVRVQARYPGGAIVWLPLYDPRAEVRAASIDVRMHVFQPLAFGPGGPEGSAPEALCVALGRVAPDEGSDGPLVCLPVPAYEGLPVARGGFA
jgi:hypothetical protein